MRTFVTDPRNIPAQMMASLKGYIETGRPVGQFLQAVISNNLKDAVGRADDTNIALLPAYVVFLYNEAPALCWGSTELYKAWIAKKESERKEKQA